MIYMFDFSKWKKLTSEQAEYLIQVRGPHDLFPYIVRDLVTINKVHTAAILYDDTFMMTYHFKNLLLNIPVRCTFVNDKIYNSCMTKTIYRHVFKKIMPSDDFLVEQIEWITSWEIKNFIILAR